MDINSIFAIHFSTYILKMRCVIISAAIITILIPVYGSETINVDEIVQQINDLPDNTWQAHAYDQLFSTIEKMRIKLGWLYEDEVDTADQSTQQVSANNDHTDDAPLPVNYDIRQRYPDCRSPKWIWDQANCASAYAIGTLSSISDRFCIHSNGKINLFLSPQHLISCNKNNDGCDGGYISRTLEYMRKNGTVTGGDYESDVGCQPYELFPCGYPQKLPCPCKISITPKCKGIRCTNEYYYKNERKLYRIIDWTRLRSKEEEIQREIYNRGSVVAGLYIYQDFFFYKKGIYKSNRREMVGGHVVKIIGWGEENGVNYWLAANSWGDDWGENGFIKIKRGDSGCNIEHYVSAAWPLSI